MNRGDKVIISAYPNRKLERLAWDEQESYGVVCRQESMRCYLVYGWA